MPASITRIFTLTFLVACALVSSTVAADACVCASIDASPACEVYKAFDVAFVGRAVRVPPNRAGGRVRFQVTQALHGVKGRDVTVLNDESGMGCGRQFEEGQEYVVFAQRNDQGAIDIGPCNSTVWMVHPPDWAAAGFRREAAEAAAFAESLRKPAAGGRIFGDVQMDEQFHSIKDNDDGMRPVDGATVVLEGPRDTRRTTTVNGAYEFTGLPAGDYRVSVTTADGSPPAKSTRPPRHLVEQERGSLFSYEREYARNVTIADARSCGYAPFEVTFEGEISGSVVQSDNTPATGLTVEIFPSTGPALTDRYFHAPTASTNSQGIYRFEHLRPGRYIVGINLRDDPTAIRATPYKQPGESGPSIVELGLDAHADLGVLRLLPQPVERHIAGTVKWSDERPSGRARVQVFEDRPGSPPVLAGSRYVESDGTFHTELYEGRTYIVQAEGAGPRGFWNEATDQPIPPIATAKVTIKVEGDRRDLLLVLTPDRDRH